MSTIVITVNPHDRLQLSTKIENLIDMLDDLSPDPDLEDGGDAEPSLGWPMGHGLSQLDKSMCHDDDREDDGGDREIGCEDEGAQCEDEGAVETDGSLFITGGGEDVEAHAK